MSHYHAIVWIDRQRAAVWQLTETESEHSVVHAHGRHEHADGGKHGRGQRDADHAYFDEVARALAGAQEILVIGPAEAKHDFIKYLGDKRPATAKLVIAVETADHPTDKQILAYARKHFPALERMRTTP